MKSTCFTACVAVFIAACNQVISGPAFDEEEQLGTEENDAVCEAPRLVCDGLCIDPETDPTHCGARGDCAGTNAGQFCDSGATCERGVCVGGEVIPTEPTQAQCINCSFELGDFTGWMIQDLSSAYVPLVIERAGFTDERFFPAEPTDGEFALIHGFDGDGPGLISASQLIEIPVAQTTTMSFEYRAAWDLANYGAVEPRTFSVQIEAPGGLPLASEVIIVAEAGTLVPDTGVLPGTVDLSGFGGQAVNIDFLWEVSEDYSGPAFFQLDNIRIVSE